MRLRNRVYGEAVAQALTVLWKAADRVCGKRLKPLIPMLVDAMERFGHLDLDPVIKTKVLQVSAATIDRILAVTRARIDGQRKRRKGVGSAIRRSIPVRTFADWLDPPPGYFEFDMVEHCGGPKTDRDYVHTLTMTDIATGWTEPHPRVAGDALDPLRQLRARCAGQPARRLGAACLSAFGSAQRTQRDVPSSLPTLRLLIAAAQRGLRAMPHGQTMQA